MDELNATFDFDVALSFAGEDRSYVHGIAERLRAHGVRVFYDEYAAVDTWGADLGELLDEIYRKRARFAVAFISKYYVGKPWPTHERRSALARALIEAEPYFLPVRLDDSELPGLRSTVGFVNARSKTPEQIVDMIVEKLGRRPGRTRPPSRRVSAPRNPEQQRQLLAERPDGWEYMLFAGVLIQGMEAAEPKWRDHQLRYIRRSGPRLDNSQAFDFISDMMNEAEAVVSNLDSLFATEAQTAAFGPPGVPGDPAQIEHIGRRLVGIYEDLLNWSARVRGAMTSDDLKRLFEIASRFVDKPLLQFREFIVNFAAEADRIPERLESPGDRPIRLEFELVLDLDRRTQAQLHRELRRLRRRRFWGLME
jgi:hypothetical protein